MGNAIRARLSYANVMATVAVFIALGGGAWAVSKNSVGQKALKANSVGASEILKGAVRSGEVKNETLLGSDVAPNTIGGADVTDNSLGGADVNESTLFNDNSLTGADVNESTLSGMPILHGGHLAQDGTDTINLAEGSLSFVCSSPSVYHNASGADATMISLTGDHNDVNGGSEVVFATPTIVPTGTDSNFSFSGNWIQGAIVTDANVARFEMWNRFNSGPNTCDYAFSVTEVPRNN